jgi:4-hydroxythreonine-4-phosphate dehydrogenase
MERIKIGITQGDINGIGYELILNTFEAEEMASLCTPIIYGSPKVATFHRKALGNQTSFQVVEDAERAKDGVLNMVNCFGEEEQKIELGQASEEAGASALVSLNMALEDLKVGKIDALVTSPVNNATIKLEDGGTLKSQTAYIETVAGEGKKALKIFIASGATDSTAITIWIIRW